jgi:hypothetical protein
MLLERSGQERLKMGCSMHTTVQALVGASILQRHPNAHPSEVKRLLFLHFYGADFEPPERKRIASALARSGRGNGRGRKLAIEVLDASKRTTRKPLDLMNLAVVKSSESGAVREKEEMYGGKGKNGRRKKRAKKLRS